MPITAYAPREVLGLGREGERLLDSVIMQINNQLKERNNIYRLGSSLLSGIELAEKIPEEYKKLSEEQKTTFFLLLRSEYVREGWRDLVLHTRNAEYNECFSVTLSI
jgi:hypothetical protein